MHHEGDMVPTHREGALEQARSEVVVAKPAGLMAYQRARSEEQMDEQKAFEAEVCQRNRKGQEQVDKETNDSHDRHGTHSGQIKKAIQG